MWELDGYMCGVVRTAPIIVIPKQQEEIQYKEIHIFLLSLSVLSSTVSVISSTSNSISCGFIPFVYMKFVCHFIPFLISPHGNLTLTYTDTIKPQFLFDHLLLNRSKRYGMKKIAERKVLSKERVHDGCIRSEEEDREGIIQSICQSISMEYPYLVCGSHRIKSGHGSFVKTQNWMVAMDVLAGAALHLVQGIQINPLTLFIYFFNIYI